MIKQIFGNVHHGLAMAFGLSKMNFNCFAYTYYCKNEKFIISKLVDKSLSNLVQTFFIHGQRSLQKIGGVAALVWLPHPPF
jgi:hypothetical protein